MIAAADATLLNDAELKGSAAVAAMSIEETDPTAFVAEQHQILAENPNRQRQILQFRRHRHRLPEATKVFATRGIRADVSQFRVFSGHLATVVATIGLPDRLLLLPFHFPPPQANLVLAPNF